MDSDRGGKLAMGAGKDFHILELQWLFPERDADLPLPAYHSELAAGMDVCAALPEPLLLVPGATVLVATGFAVAIAPGYELQVRPRSGLAIKHGVTVINAPGTIDADYRGEVKIGLINLSVTPFLLQRGDRIAQLVLAPCLRATIRPVASLSATARDQGGFGHTGR